MAFVLDGLPAVTAAYSFRRLSTAYVANKGVQIRRASDNATLDTPFLANGDPDTATINAFLAATTGFLTTKYDGSGNGFDLTQPTAANQPAVVIAEPTMGNRPVGSYLAARVTALSHAATPVVAQPFTMAAVCERTANFAATNHIFSGIGQNSTLFWLSSVNNIAAFFGTSRSVTANDNVAHCFAALTGVNKLAIDGVISSPGSLGAQTLSGLRVGASNTLSNPMTGFIGEAILWAGTLSDADLGILQADQKAWWIDGISPPLPSTDVGSIGTGGGSRRRSRRRVEDQPLLYHPPLRRPWEKSDSEPVSTPPAPPVVSPPKAAPPPVVVAPLDFSAERRDLAALRAELAGVQADLDDEADMLDYLDATE